MKPSRSLRIACLGFCSFANELFYPCMSKCIYLFMQNHIKSLTVVINQLICELFSLSHRSLSLFISVNSMQYWKSAIVNIRRTTFVGFLKKMSMAFTQRNVIAKVFCVLACFCAFVKVFWRLLDGCVII